MTVFWTLVTGPTSEPLSIAEAKAQARIVDDESNTLLRSYIVTARQAAEEYLNRGLLTQTWRCDLSAFADEMWLPMAAPLQTAVDVAPIVRYYDVNGVLQTLATSAYVVDAYSRPGRIVRAPNTVWPAVQPDRIANVVQITYVVGWTTPALIPERIKQGLRMYVTYLDADRDGMEPQAQAARSAAEACWSDRIAWREPTICAWARSTNS